MQKTILNELLFEVSKDIKDIQSEWFTNKTYNKIFQIIKEVYKTKEGMSQELVLNHIDKNYTGIMRDGLIRNVNEICKDISLDEGDIEQLKTEYENTIINQYVKGLNGLDIKTKKEKILRLSDILKKNINEYELKSLQDIKINYDKNIDKKKNILYTSWKKFNERTGGFIGYNIIAARTSLGKTDVIINLIIEFMKQKRRGIYFTFEDNAENLYNKLLSYELKINRMNLIKKQLNIDEKEKVKNCNNFNHSYLYVCDKSIKIYAIKDMIINAIEKYNIDYFVIDYIGLIEREYKQEIRAEINEISHVIKNLINDKKIVGFILSQVNNRYEDERKYTQHRLGHLKESGKLEEDADMVIFIEGQKEVHERTLYVAKNRFGLTGNRINFNYDNRYGILGEIYG